MVKQRKKSLSFGEFVRFGCEDAMVTGSDGKLSTTSMSLSNGCVCRTVRDDFVYGSGHFFATAKPIRLLPFGVSGLWRIRDLNFEMFWVDEELECEIRYWMA